MRRHTRLMSKPEPTIVESPILTPEDHGKPRALYSLNLIPLKAVQARNKATKRSEKYQGRRSAGPQTCRPHHSCGLSLGTRTDTNVLVVMIAWGCPHCEDRARCRRAMAALICNAPLRQAHTRDERMPGD
jgi:hypothetical protein